MSVRLCKPLSVLSHDSFVKPLAKHATASGWRTSQENWLCEKPSTTVYKLDIFPLTVVLPSWLNLVSVHRPRHFHNRASLDLIISLPGNADLFGDEVVFISIQ